MVNIMYMNLIDMEFRRDNLCMELSTITEANKKLIDINFELEVDHFNSLQDITVLETQLIKYQNELRDEEKQLQSLRNDLKKLQQEKLEHEQILSHFKNEMAVMSEQLINLQEILEFSNQASQEENQELIKAVTNLQDTNQRLQSQLNDNEQKMVHDGEIRSAKINELQLVITQKDNELEIHDQAINELKTRLDQTIKENIDLQLTIGELNRKINELQMNEYNQEICNELTEKIQKLEARNQKKIDELVKENNQLRQILNDAKRELEQIRDNKEIFKLEVNTMKEALENKQEEMKLENSKLHKKYEDIKNKLQITVNEKQKLEGGSVEMKREYESILQELKESLSKINAGLIDGRCMNKSYLRNKKCHCNVIEGCKIEIGLTEKLLENFKDEHKQLSNMLNALNEQNKDLNRKLQSKNDQVCCCEEFMEFLKTEIRHVRICEDFNATTRQDEMLLLKNQIKRIIQDQISVQEEKNKLLSQINRLQSAITKHEDANRLLHSQYEANHLELKHLLDNNKILQQDKDDLNNELETLQNHCGCLEKKNRQLAEMIRNLELELMQTKTKRDDICAESKYVIDCVRAWLNEQKKINNELQQRKLSYSCRIKNNPSSVQNLHNKPSASCLCGWTHSLESQSTGSTGCPSPCSCSLDEELNTARDKDVDDDDDDDYDTTDTERDDEFVRRAERLTHQIRCRNRCFKNKFPNFLISKNGN